MAQQKGFSLVELLVALTIFAIGLLALAGMQITGIQGNSRAQSVSAKVALADGVIEEFLAMDGDDPALESDAGAALWEILPGVTSLDIEGAGTCTVEVTIDADPKVPEVTGPEQVGLTKIVVTALNTSGTEITRTIFKRRY